MAKKRTLSIILVLALLCSLVPNAAALVRTGEAENTSERPVPFEKVDAIEEMPERSEHEAERDCIPYRDTDPVRVSIVLEQPAALERQGFHVSNVDSTYTSNYRRNLQQEQKAVSQKISEQVLNGRELDTVWNLTLTANLISANVRYGEIEKIEQIHGVKEVVIETRYEPAVYSADGASPNMATSAEMIGTSAAYTSGYTGAGMRIAVIDTGTDTDHQSFDAKAFAHAIAEDEAASGKTYDLLSAKEIAEKLHQLNAYKNNPSVTADQLYISSKLAFGYNYVDRNVNVTHDSDTQGEHGSHVAGIAAANRYIKTEDGFEDALDTVLVQGAAPDAQIITMKVFGEGGGAYDSDYLAAIEDALVLGCDAINLSLGSAYPGSTTNAIYQDILDRLAQTDTVVSISAGNAGTWADGTWNGYLYSDDINFDMVSAPGSYTHALTVASVQNVGHTGQYLTVAGKKIFYNEMQTNGAVEYTNESLSTLAGRELEYVLIDGYGNVEDWEGIDLTGKVAVCSRGDISFYVKAENAVELGAVAVIIYNHEPGVINMDLTDYTKTAPVVSITQDEGAWLREQGKKNQAECPNEDGNTAVYFLGTMTVSEEVASSTSSDGSYQMSSFSSWGVPGDLSLKPEITAPGGNIYSVNGAIAGGAAYETMSGTSMAAPQVAGMAALLAQYIEEKGLAEKTGLSVRKLSQSLLMSTAQPLVEEKSGSYYAVLQQGAGLANVGDAIAAGAYILVDGQNDGKIKAELGDDPTRSGEYVFTFSVNNMTSTAQQYDLSAALFTQDIFESYASENAQYNGENGYDYDTAYYLDRSTTPLEAAVTWTIDGRQLEQGKELPDANEDGVCNLQDVQAILDNTTGKGPELVSAADLDRDGKITTYDAGLYLEALNSGSVVVPANDSVQIRVHIQLTDGQRAALNAEYCNGAYVEGYVFVNPVATEEGILEVGHSIPVLAFYGNWTDASMFERGCRPEWMASTRPDSTYMGLDAVNYLTYTYEGDGTVYYLGANPISEYGAAYLQERTAINSNNGICFAQYRVNPIRNAANSKLQIVNAETGEVYFERESGPLSSGYYYVADQSWYNNVTGLALGWAANDANGEPLPDGTVLNFNAILAPEYNVNPETGETDWAALGKGACLTTQVTVDNTAPEILAVSVDQENMRLNVTARDNQFVAGCVLRNVSGNGSGLGSSIVDQKVAGETVTVSLPIYIDYWGTKVRATVYDYAENYAVYELDVSEILGITEQKYEFAACSEAQWLNFNADSSSDNVGPAVPETITAAANAEGYVFYVTDTGDLYMKYEDLMDEGTFIRNLGISVDDMAYNPMDREVYGISGGKLVRIDQLDGAVEPVGSVGAVNTNSLACNAQGNFYCLDCDDGNLYTFTLDSLAAPTKVGSTGYEMCGPQSLEWNFNDNQLYWLQLYNPGLEGYYAWVSVVQVNPATGAGSLVFDFYWYDNLPGLIIRDLNRDTSHDDERYPVADKVTETQVSNSTLSLHIYEAEKLTANVLPWNVSDRDVVWSSSDEAVASVDQNGVVTGRESGTCTITASSVLDQSVRAECVVRVSEENLADVELRGVLRDTDGTTKLFSWNPEQEETWRAGAELGLASGAVAYDAENDLLYIQDTMANNYRMHRIDPNTGETLATSRHGARSGMPSSDMAFCEYIGDDSAVSVYSTYFGAPSVVMDNEQIYYGLNLSSYLAMITNADALIAVTSAGQQMYSSSIENEDGSISEINCDAECFYMMDNNGFVWALWLYPSTGGYGAGLAVYPTDLATQLPFLTDKDFQNCSMVEDRATGTLYLSYFNGSANVLYALYPVRDAQAGDILSFQSVEVGSFGDGVWPASLYYASVAAPESQHRLCSQTGDVFQTVSDFSQLNLAGSQQQEAIGALHAADGAVSNAEHFVPDGVIYVQIPAVKTAKNGLVSIDYDSSVLSLQQVECGAMLSSVNTSETGTVRLSFADTNAIPANTALATLTFAIEEGAAGLTAIEMLYTEINEEIGTCQKPVARKTSVYSLTGECPSQKFTDVKQDIWYHEAIDYMVANGYLYGVSETVMAPNATLTRGMMATLFYRIAGNQKVEGKTAFTDVRSGRWYSDAILWAEMNGFVKGTSSTTFCPDLNATREMAITVLYRYAQGEADTTDHLSGFKDASRVSGWAREAVNWAVGEGIIQGDGTGLNPKRAMTRAEFAQMLFNYLNK